MLLVLTIGLRHEVGGDWITYNDSIERAYWQTLTEAMLEGDPAYGVLNWAAARTDLGPYLINFVCAVVFVWGLVHFCRAQPRPWLSLVVAMPYLVTVVAMGYTRQGTAIGFVLFGLIALARRSSTRFVVFVALASIFHKSAVVLVPLAILSGTKNRIWTAVWVGVSSVLLYMLLLHESVESLQISYLEARYESSGAAIRVAMNAVPAAVFLVLRRRFTMPEADRSFWTWMAIGGLIFIVLLEVSPSSTAVDRVALYWIPVQLFVLSRLPDALGSDGASNTHWVFAVVLYSATVLLVWLIFAAHAFRWLPYQFYPVYLLSN